MLLGLWMLLGMLEGWVSQLINLEPFLDVGGLSTGPEASSVQPNCL